MLAYGTAIAYTIATLVFKIYDNSNVGKRMWGNVLNEFKGNLVLSSEQTLVCEPCSRSVSTRCRAGELFQRGCLKLTAAKLKTWDWKNLYHRAQVAKVITKDMKAAAVTGYLTELRRHSSNLFMLFYEYAIVCGGWAVGHTVFFAMQWSPKSSEHNHVLDFQVKLWASTVLLVVLTIIQFMNVMRPIDGFQFACQGKDDSRSYTQDCKFWHECRTCEGLEGNDLDACSNHGLYADHLDEMRAGNYTTPQVDNWIERTAVCWALTRPVKGHINDYDSFVIYKRF